MMNYSDKGWLADLAVVFLFIAIILLVAYEYIIPWVMSIFMNLLAGAV